MVLHCIAFIKILHDLSTIIGKYGKKSPTIDYFLTGSKKGESLYRLLNRISGSGRYISGAVTQKRLTANLVRFFP